MPRPIVLGVVGDSGAGKTTLTRGLIRVLGEEHVARLNADDYHRYDRRMRREMGITPLHPECNHLDILTQHLLHLRRGESVLKPVYDHRDGTLRPPSYLRPARFLCVEGLLTFHTETLRSAHDVRVFLAPPEELRRGWKLTRDCTRRQYTTDEVLRELDRREADAIAYITPQRAYADLIVTFTASRSADPSHLDADVLLRDSLEHPDLSPLLDVDHGGVALVRRERDLLLRIPGDLTDEQTVGLEESVWDRMSFASHLRARRLGEFTVGTSLRRSNSLALVQLIVLTTWLRRGPRWRSAATPCAPSGAPTCPRLTHRGTPIGWRSPMAVTLTQLHAFLAVARCGSVTAAAAELVVTQPSVSAAVAALEREVGGVEEQRDESDVVEVAALELLEAVAQLGADPRRGGLRDAPRAGLLAERLDVAHRQPAHERADDQRLERLGPQQLGAARKQSRDERRGGLADLRDLDRQLALGRLQRPRPEPVAHARLEVGPALVSGAAQPRVELLLDRALDDQPRAELGQLRQRLARVLANPDGQQLVDLSFELRRRRYGASHGVGLLHRLPGLEGTYAASSTAPARYLQRL
nr:phosphoribulokinase [Capillimicrobium parvum]